ncbi:MAG: ATP-dependent zinc metalloprotease FtsH [Ruminococcaceae bacterium]|nr:ATP-dependent zinc metalloprotease FtsH [Oscillospiraceae bacterium]
MQTKNRGFFSWVMTALIIILLVSVISDFFDKTIETDYSSLVKCINGGMVSQLYIDDTTATAIVGEERIRCEIPSKEVLRQDVGDKILEMIDSGALQYGIAPKRVSWIDYAMPITSLLLMGFFLFILIQQNSGKGAGNFARSRAKLETNDGRKVKFSDVAGADEEKEELSELVDFLKNPQKFIALGARIPKGVLMVGSPGTGKTLLARAVAGEAGVPFFSVSGSDFVELYVGVGASRVRDMFAQAKKSRPCIIFIDEIDVVGRQRGAGMGGGHDEREQTLNQLLVEMDGFDKNEGIIIMAATNRPDILDPALLRPGRFDRQIVVDRPDVKGREAILKVHARNKNLAKDVDLEKVAKATVGYTGADLENVLNEAAIFAARRNKTEIDQRDIDDANIKVMMGPEKASQVVTEREKKLTAFHEAGHAVLTKLVSKTETVQQVSIIPRGRAGGYTMHLPDEDTWYRGKKDMLRDIIILLGGRVAEELVMEDISTGASSDLKRATKIAHEMVAKYGMSDAMGPICYDSSDEVFLGRDYGHSKQYSETTASQIDKEVESIINGQYKEAKSLLTENIGRLNSVANALLEKEVIDGAEFLKYFNQEGEKENETSK